MKPTKPDRERVQELIKQHPDWGRHRIAEALGWSTEKARWWMSRASLPPAAPKADPPAIQAAKKVPMKFGRLDLKYVDQGNWVRVGLVADTHLACQEERLSELHTQYDLFESEGIRDVLHAGNLVDGYLQKLNGSSAIVSAPDDQAQYAVDNYPARKGITTHFITGADHEGWFVKQGLNWGALLEHAARAQGRQDLHYLGHVEADIEIMCRQPRHPMIKLQHPGGGSCYARSYAPQKIIESLEGGEKPDVLVLGHYHVNDYFNERNVHVVALPGFQDQTIFARQKRLRMEVGGAILEFKIGPTGGVTRCRVEFNMYYNRGFYKRFLRSDSKLVKGHLRLN